MNSSTTNQTALRDANHIPLAWVVWIDDNMGYSAPNWEINKPGDHPEESLEEALKHAAETLAMGYPTAIRPVGSPPVAFSDKPYRPDDSPLYQAKRLPSARGHKSVLVFGPQGSGKTTHAEALRKHFDLAAVLEDWVPGDPWPMTDHLVLSHMVPPDCRRRRAIPIEKALAKLRDNAPGYPF